MSAEGKGLTRQTQLILLLLALLPVWYSMREFFPAAAPSPGAENPYYMECVDCGFESSSGPEPIPEVHCPRCTRPDAFMVFRTRSSSRLWDLVIKLLVGMIAFLAVLVLVFGGNAKKKGVKEAERRPLDEAAAAKARSEAKEELNAWARGFMENRRKRLGGED